MLAPRVRGSLVTRKQPEEEGLITIPTLQSRRLKPREAGRLAQGHTAETWAWQGGPELRWSGAQTPAPDLLH